MIITLTVQTTGITDKQAKDAAADMLLAIEAAGGVVKKATVDTQNADDGKALAAARKTELGA